MVYLLSKQSVQLINFFFFSRKACGALVKRVDYNSYLFIPWQMPNISFATFLICWKTSLANWILIHPKREKECFQISVVSIFRKSKYRTVLPNGEDTISGTVPRFNERGEGVKPTSQQQVSNEPPSQPRKLLPHTTLLGDLSPEVNQTE